jgi:diaminopropionate ammonia-lyase
VVRPPGNYDHAVEQVERDARKHGWYIISDTAYEGQTETPRDVMHGYRVIVDEVVQQLSNEPRPSHIFVQAGVGGIAAAFCSHLWEIWEEARPRFVVVESKEANCLMRSAQAGRLTSVTGALETRMCGLAAGKPSALAWEILRLGANDFVTIGDDASFAAMRFLAKGVDGDPRVVSGEAGAAGVGALMAAFTADERAHALGLEPASRVLLISTEGATDLHSYRSIVGSATVPH